MPPTSTARHLTVALALQRRFTPGEVRAVVEFATDTPDMSVSRCDDTQLDAVEAVAARVECDVFFGRTATGRIFLYPVPE